MRKNWPVKKGWMVTLSLILGRLFIRPKAALLSIIIYQLSISPVGAQISISPAGAQTTDPVLMTIAGEEVLRSEFVYAYEHNRAVDGNEQVALSEFLDGFIDYKLKVRAALDAGLDQLDSYRNEVAIYCGTPAAATTTADDAAIRDAETAWQQACRHAAGRDMLLPAQIFLHLGQRASTDEQMRLQTRIDSIYAALQDGADFAELARRLSDDEASACQGGLMGWVGPDQLLLEVEQAAYALQQGEMSRPFLATDGFHILLMTDRQPATSAVVHDAFVRACLAPRASNLVARPAPDAQLLRSYREGLLVREITRVAVSDEQVSDEKALYRYYKKNKKRYGKKLKNRDFERVRPLVEGDYRQYLELQWASDLRNRYRVKVNKHILRTIE